MSAEQFGIEDEQPIAISDDDDSRNNTSARGFHAPSSSAVADLSEDNPNNNTVSGKRGRHGSGVWDFFTNDSNPHLRKSAVCKHCRSLVNHHKKSESARVHLNKCTPFRRLMNGMEEDSRPTWYMGNKKPKIPLPSSSQVSSNSPSISRQCGIKEFTLPAVSKQQKLNFQKHMAMHYYSTGTSFHRIEDVHLKAAIKTLRPDDNLLPNRRKLASTLLEACHEDLEAKVAKRMNGATACLVTDAWSNVKNDSVINYMAVSPECSLFLESVLTGQQGHDHKFIAEDIARVIRNHKFTTFAGAVTDNTSTNKKAWGLLNNMFPSRYFQGCASHGLHLFVKDVFAATKTKKAGQAESTYPDQYPFEAILEFVASCKDVVKFFHNHHVAKAQLQERQQAANARALARTAPTRWGTIQAMCQTLLESEHHLHDIVTMRDFVNGTAVQKAERLKVKEIVTDEAFVDNLKKALAILAPLDNLIVKYQSDKVPISEVLPDFKSLPNEFRKILACDIITRQEFDYLVLLSERRFQFMYGVAHGLSYLLDPRYIGDGLLTELRTSLEESLINTPVDDITLIDEERKEKLFIQFTAYFITATQERRTQSFRYKMLAKGSKTVLQYWLTDGCQWPELQQIAFKLFSMATSSAASERNFSMTGFIHSKLRNSLSAKTVEKLVFIKSNLLAFYECQKLEEDLSDSESCVSERE